MPELEYFLAAESYSTDRDTNWISIFNVLTQMTADQGFPHTIQRMHLISCWYSTDEEIRDERDSQVIITMKLPGEEPEEPFPVNFTSSVRFQHLILGYPGIRVERPGLLEIELKLNGEHKARHRIVLESPHDL